MAFARVGGLDLCYEAFGSADDPTVLLVHGLGGQLLAWDESFCRAVVAGGYHVIRFDLRDSGLSPSVAAGKVALPTLVAAIEGGGPIEVPYDLSDMARDAVGLLDELGVDRAHIVGLSMGGMIGQTMAFVYPAMSVESAMATNRL